MNAICGKNLQLFNLDVVVHSGVLRCVCVCVWGGGVFQSPPPTRNSEVFKNLSLIPSSGENTYVTT
jgi:hypothetical protein